MHTGITICDQAWLGIEYLKTSLVVPYIAADRATIQMSKSWLKILRCFADLLLQYDAERMLSGAAGNKL